MIYYRVFLSVFRIRVAKSNVHIPAHFIFKDTLVRFPGSFDFVHQDVVCCFVPWKVYLETQRVLFVVSHFGAVLLLKCRVVIMVLKMKITFTCLGPFRFYLYYYKCCTMLWLHNINYRNGAHPHLIHHYNLLRRYIVVRQCSIHYHHCIHAYQGRSWRKASGDIFLRTHQRHDYSLRWRLKPKQLCKDRLSPLPILLWLANIILCRFS